MVRYDRLRQSSQTEAFLRPDIQAGNIDVYENLLKKEGTPTWAAYDKDGKLVLDAIEKLKKLMRELVTSYLYFRMISS
jgi:hypothetical protein